MKRYIVHDRGRYWTDRDAWVPFRHLAQRYTEADVKKYPRPLCGGTWVDIFPEVGKPMRCPRCAGRGYYSGTDRGRYRLRDCPRCGGRGEVICTRPIRFFLVNISGASASYWRDKSPIGWWGDKRGATRFTNEQRAKLEADAAKLGTTVGGIWQEC